MNKLISILLVSVLLCLSACTAAPPVIGLTPSPTPQAAAAGPPAPPPTSKPDEFYTNYKNAENRPLAVMIDNDNSAAWPHSGLEDAYLLYEINVEGGATRIMALFNRTETQKIGPVRSSRHYFLDYALEHDAVYTHYGWSPRAQSDIRSLGVNNINGLSDNYFWRETKYAGDYHSAFTSVERINAAISDKRYRSERNGAPLNLSPHVYELNGEAADKVTIPFSGFYTVGFEYDDTAKTYKRFMNSREHPLQNNAAIAAKNIIVIYMGESLLGDGSDRINIYNIASGKGYFFTGGKYIPITWSKPSRSDATSFKNEAGDEIKLNPGQTWIEIVPNNYTITIK